MIERIVPDNEEHWHQLRAPNINSTEVAALFNLSPYMTKFELWHRKKDQQIVTLEDNERMRWGNRLQASIATGIAEDEGWKVRRMNRYIFDPEKRLGSSFDYEIVSDGLLECKNVDTLQFRDGWMFDDDGNCEAPPHIEIQLQQQLWVAKKQFGWIAALVGGNQLQKIKREPDQKIWDAILTEASKFWASIAENKAPNPDYARDAEFIFTLFGSTVAGKSIDVRDDKRLLELAMSYRVFSEQMKKSETERKAIKAQLLELVGDAEKALGESFTLSASAIAPTVVETYERKGYRDFRINWKKEKPKGAINDRQPEI